VVEVEEPLVTSAKEEILRRIRRATRDVPEGEHPEDVPVERGYRKKDDASHEVLAERFAERVAEYEAIVHRVSEEELPRAIVKACQRRNVERLVVPNDLPKAWVPEGVKPLRDGENGGRLSNDELDESDGVLTGCSLGIAQTGTIVLDAGEGQGRRALTLLPDYHLCVVREKQIVSLVPEAFANLEEAIKKGRAITFISGPSATSDIELDRVEGVHGPRTLEVLIVG
jgi:L-lactate dehydrogenase complex protein LldG